VEYCLVSITTMQVNVNKQKLAKLNSALRLMQNLTSFKKDTGGNVIG